MPAKVKVPKLTENTDEVTITAWLKKEGDTIGKGEKLVEMTTDKAVFEVESPCSGVVRKILAKVKSVLPTGYVVALVGTAAEPLPDVSASNEKLLAHRSGSAPAAKPRVPPGAPAAPPPAAASVPAGAAVRATPAARRLAREKGIDLAKLRDDIKVEVITEDMVRQSLA
jgi:pyruvate/2-oxoglutarate dehydrogenase complex dihydrolipoamide acyltransferase (E2) component